MRLKRFTGYDACVGTAAAALFPRATWSLKRTARAGLPAHRVALAALVFVGPLAVLYTARSPDSRPRRVRMEPKSVFVWLSAGSILRISDDRLDPDGPRLPVPAIRGSDMRASASATELKNDIERFTSGQTMANVYDLKTGRMVWLVTPTEGLLSTPSGVFQVCGQDTLDPLSKNYAVFYGQTVALVARNQSSASGVPWGAPLLVAACLAWFSGMLFFRADHRSLTAARGSLESLSAKVARPFEGRGWRGGIWRAVSLAIPLAVFVAVVTALLCAEYAHRVLFLGSPDRPPGWNCAVVVPLQT